MSIITIVLICVVSHIIISMFFTIGVMATDAISNKGEIVDGREALLQTVICFCWPLVFITIICQQIAKLLVLIVTPRKN